ncbi:FAD-dependent oxidoreductase [Hydrocarboniphaga sp.]|uniref:FAD-dependent oxidoreductase n=1 Tax=Hydrocarboniphaga sp. TaxID=2033016 RepID=UPI003D0C200B
MADRCDIAVVGGGVVGAAAALALSRAGFDVQLIERGMPPALPSEEYDPRVYAIAPSSAALLRELDVWPQLPAQRLCAYQRMRVWESAPERALAFDAADVGESQLGWIAEQSQLLAALWRALPAGVARTNTSVDGASFEQGALLQLSGGDLQARLVIAAEGAGSPLRERAGIVTTQREYEQLALVAHVTTREPHRGLALQRFLPGGPLAFLPLADGRRSIVWSLPVDEARRLQALPQDEFHQQLASAIQFETGDIVDSTPRALFPLRLMHATEYVRDALALVGDSAHVVHPLAGQGVNLGLADVAELLRVLTGAREQRSDWAGARVLRRYERARKAANLEMLALTDLLDRSFRSVVPGLPRVLDAGLALLDRIAPAKQALIRRALA